MSTLVDHLEKVKVELHLSENCLVPLEFVVVAKNSSGDMHTIHSAETMRAGTTHTYFIEADEYVALGENSERKFMYATTSTLAEDVENPFDNMEVYFQIPLVKELEINFDV